MKMQSINRYEAYKDSGIEWLGDVPTTWALKRHKDNFIFVSDKCVNPSLEKVGLENIEGKTGRFITTNSEFDGDGVEFKKNDILFGKLRPYLAKVYLAEFNGNAVGDIFVYRPKKNITSKFAQYLMLSDRYIDVINSSTAGAKMPRVSSNFIANLPVSTPLIKEQIDITAYLDTKTAQIDRKTELLSQKAAQYGKLKQSLINETVTRGLDKTVPMKDSGVEWIGEVPVHWNIFTIKQIFTYVVDNRGKTPPIESSGIPMLEIRHLRSGSKYPLLGYDKFVSQETHDNFLRNYLATGDILFGTVGSIGQTAIVPQEFNYCIAQNIVGFRTRKSYCPDFYYYFLTSTSFLKCMSLANKQSIQESIKVSNLIRNFIPVPPNAEQTAIAVYLDEKTAHIDRIISTINSQIDKLKELRKTLINDVVTGKIKVA